MANGHSWSRYCSRGRLAVGGGSISMESLDISTVDDVHLYPLLEGSYASERFCGSRWVGMRDQGVVLPIMGPLLQVLPRNINCHGTMPLAAPLPEPCLQVPFLPGLLTSLGFSHVQSCTIQIRKIIRARNTRSCFSPAHLKST